MLSSTIFELVGGRRLHCEGCERRLERALKGLQGVRRVRADASSQRVEVLFDAAVLDSAAIAKRFAKAGYEARESPKAPDPPADAFFFAPEQDGP